MSAERITVTGIVLSVMPIGDYDRRITILTKERGKIGVFAKGARRPGSAFLACTQVCIFGEFTLYEGKNSYNLSDAAVKNYFSGLRTDVEKAYYGMYFCEVANYLTREGNDEREVLKLLYTSFRALTSDSIPNELIKAVFEIKIMYINGEGPLLDECVCCHKKQETQLFFSVERGGAVCEDCKDRLMSLRPRGTDEAHAFENGLEKSDSGNAQPVFECRELNSSSWYALWFIAETPPEKLYTFNVSRGVLDELAALGEDYLRAGTNHSFEGGELLKMLECQSKFQ